MILILLSNVTCFIDVGVFLVKHELLFSLLQCVESRLDVHLCTLLDTEMNSVPCIVLSRWCWYVGGSRGL